MLRKILLHIAKMAKADGVSDYLVRYNPILRARVQRAIRPFRQPGANIAALSDALTVRSLRAACRTSYGAGRSVNIRDWPLLDKETARHTPAFLHPHSFIRIPAGTGGTNGVPLRLWRSLESVVAEQVFIDDLMLPYNVSMRSRMAVLRADSVKAPGDLAPPYGRISHGGQRLTLSSPHLNPETLRWYYDALKDFAPEVLWVYPSMASNFLKLLQEAGLPLSIPVIIASSEMMMGSAHRALQDYFQAHVINYYGQAERVCFAYSTQPDVFHFNPAYGRVELIDSTLSADGTERYAKIVGTSFWNRTMPLVRYVTGDSITVPAGYGEAELAQVALGLLPFTHIAGRESEYILTRDGMRIIGLNQIPREVQNITQIQIIQLDFDTVEIHVIAHHGFGDEDAGRLREQARAKFPSSTQVTVKPVERLITTPAGKTPFVVRQFK